MVQWEALGNRKDCRKQRNFIRLAKRGQITQSKQKRRRNANYISRKGCHGPLKLRELWWITQGNFGGDTWPKRDTSFTKELR